MRLLPRSASVSSRVRHERLPLDHRRRRPAAAVVVDGGMVTSEYAVGTAGASAVGCVVYLLVSSDFFADLLQSILDVIRVVTMPALPFAPVLL